jgi:hypothetical protein
MIRQTCGTVNGMVTHLAENEPLCGTCAYTDQVRRIEAEGIPQRPAPQVHAPVTDDEAARHRADLLSAVESYDQEQPDRTAAHGGRRRRGGWPLRSVA